jgi:extracellular elastinolytic metalloproteinase
MKRFNLRLLAFAISSFFFLQNAGAQDHLSVAKAFIQEKATELGLSKGQVSDPMLSSFHRSEDIGVTHFYFQQHFEGISVIKAILNVHVGKDDKVLTHGSSFVPDLEGRITSSKPSISSRQALDALVNALGYTLTAPLVLKETTGGPAREVLFEKGNISLEDIPVKLVYQPMADGSVRLAWDILIDEPGGQNYWSIRVDAATGDILEKDNLVIHCNFGDVPHTHRANSTAPYHIEQVMEAAAAPAVGGGSYRVFKEPLESPSHGGRTLVSDPADAIASPFGWHDTNGVAGPEFTITRGNNVHAGLDLSAPNGIDAGSEPDGGAGLVFDFPLNLNLAPDTYRPAAVTNLFYWNNLVHDFSYKYGFTEAAGNFQVNNYGRGGAGNDDVRAEAQDYSGTNNANFATPADGQRPRMQMFIWNQGVSSVTVNPPSPFAMYSAGNAGFGPLNFNLSGDLELANPLEGCSPLVGFTPGKIAVIDRGTCPFVDKVLTAQAAGAIAVIICNNTPGDPITMGGAGAVVIPSLMLSQGDCATLKFLMNSGTVNITMDRVLAQYDSDFDNGVIAHEYAHGISNRLTGGRLTVSCLNNSEQMGEGWSDWYGLMMTLKPGDNPADVRGIGTYVSGQPTTGNGIRPTPYSTDMSINPSTYNTISSVSVPHGVGYVWCSMLWDLTWAMIEDHGFATGFDVAMWLVNDGMKMQPCSPGFVTGRNAILAADQARYGGANNCRIWEVFARRGLGVGASQGSANNVTDGVESYALPDLDGDGYSCKDDCDETNPAINPGALEICDGIDNNCNGLIDEPGSPPGPWMTDNVGPAAGNTSYNPCPAANPTFTLTASGASALNADTEHLTSSVICGVNAAITVHITHLSGGGWAGITMRESTLPGSRMVALKTQLSNAVAREVRATVNGVKQSQSFPSNPNNTWLRIIRSGNTFQFFVSTNGTTWQPVGAVNMTMNNCLLVGMFAESINVNATTTATFDNVSVSGGGMLLAPNGPELTLETSSQPDFSVFPNPTSGALNVDLTQYAGRAVRLELCSLQGQLLRFIELDEVQSTMENIDLSNHTNGMYLIRVKSEGLPDVTKRVAVTR